MPDPDMTVTTRTHKPGYRTSEFWLSLGAMALTALYASGVIGEGGQAGKIAACAGMVLTSLGYTVSRGLAKGAAQPPA